MHGLESLIIRLAETLPLEVFVTVGSYLEEVIAPIPSPSIMLIAGSFGVVQGYGYIGLALLVLFASIGKTLGGLTMYFIARKVKDVALDAFGRYIDLTQEDIARFGSKFTGTARDYAVYIFFRSVPIIPSILLSFGSGVLHLPLRLFVIGTFVGTIIRDTFYIIVGYIGTEFLYKYVLDSMEIESVIQKLVIVFVGIFFVFLIIRKRRKRQTASLSK
jgi:membrane protein DedA with SNARE-associated domain